MHIAPLRRFWQARADGWAERWEADADFRRSTSFLLTAIMLALMGICLFITMSIAHGAMPQWFGQYQVDVSGNDGHNNNYPIIGLTAIPTDPALSPQPVATANIVQPPNMLTPSPTPTPHVTFTPTVPVLPCPALTDAPTLSGQTIQDGTNPTPLVSGCAAQLVIVANEPNVPISVTLTFGTSAQSLCSVSLAGRTDGVGNATLPFTVPGQSCFQGNILTTGQVNVGGDSSANASFPAEG